ncbi:hypothetical protein [Micromonospora endophytica]|uniref:Uncharacterized protein n=1 Tax=Micromonospora endophytica TaxID=515350 RepID=A0A2W2DAQ5_9ACTN|nr:hypothetical protein [Micromonospora endophytica]PZG01019.1 hypothetical protein C1I93_00575 [Micromonospora endophytica]RIW47939.1 hypothetical protein D3H59_08675 [Micromonospora endophytica]
MDRRPAAPWAPAIVALLTVAWLGGALLLIGGLFAVGIEGWAHQTSNSDGAAAALTRKGNLVMLALATEVVAGPMAIAVVAVSGLLRRTAVVYLIIALGLGILVAPFAVAVLRDVVPSPPPSPAPTRCQEYSGGDNRCPGG